MQERVPLLKATRYLSSPLLPIQRFGSNLYGLGKMFGLRWIRYADSETGVCRCISFVAMERVFLYNSRHQE